MRGWGKIKDAAKYCSVSTRTLRDWLKRGLKHSRVDGGCILIRFSAIDEFLERFSVEDNLADVADAIVREVMSK